MSQTRNSPDRIMKVPGPAHPITIERNPNRVSVVFDGRTVATTTRALTLLESGYKPVFYIPREDVDMSLFEPSPHTTFCPYKGDASYFTIRTGDISSENAAWSYEAPYPAMEAIAGHLAFYPRRVDEIREEAT